MFRFCAFLIAVAMVMTTTVGCADVAGDVVKGAADEATDLVRKQAYDAADSVEDQVRDGINEAGEDAFDSALEDDEAEEGGLEEE